MPANKLVFTSVKELYDRLGIEPPRIPGVDWNTQGWAQVYDKNGKTIFSMYISKEEEE